jgi:hypothetical protein
MRRMGKRDGLGKLNFKILKNIGWVINILSRMVQRPIPSVFAS